jgi:hypothetical protein
VNVPVKAVVHRPRDVIDRARRVVRGRCVVDARRAVTVVGGTVVVPDVTMVRVVVMLADVIAGERA